MLQEEHDANAVWRARPAVDWTARAHALHAVGASCPAIDRLTESLFRPLVDASRGRAVAVLGHRRRGAGGRSASPRGSPAAAFEIDAALIERQIPRTLPPVAVGLMPGRNGSRWSRSGRPHS